MTNNRYSRKKIKRWFGKKKNILLTACVTATLLCMITVIALLIMLDRDAEKQLVPFPEAEEIPPREEPAVSENDTEQDIETPVIYPEPDYNLTLEEVYVPLPELSREYEIAWVSDLHLITDHEPSI